MAFLPRSIKYTEGIYAPTYDIIPWNDKKNPIFRKINHNHQEMKKLYAWEYNKCPIISVYFCDQPNVIEHLYKCNICEFNAPGNKYNSISYYLDTINEHIISRHGFPLEQLGRFYSMRTWCKWYWELVCCVPNTKENDIREVIFRGIKNSSRFYFEIPVILSENAFCCMLCGGEYGVPPAREVVLSHLKRSCKVLQGLMKALNSGKSRRLIN